MLCALICSEGCHIYRSEEEGTIVDRLQKKPKMWHNRDRLFDNLMIWGWGGGLSYFSVYVCKFG